MKDLDRAPAAAEGAQTVEPVPGLDAVTGKGGPLILSLLPADSVAKLKAIEKNEDALDALFDYLARRGESIDRSNWAIQTMHWALDLGWPGAVVDGAMQRLYRRFRPRQ